MRWQEGRRSENIEDRRGMRPRTVAAGGGGLIMLIIIVLAMLFGVDPRPLMQQAQQPQAGAEADGEAGPIESSPEEEQLKDFVATVLADTEDVWKALFQAGGRQYREPTLVLFRGQVESACGLASAAVGPFYCPADEKLYLDLAFFEELQNRFRAPGDFAQAYVIAHEIGHHVQNLLGTMEQVHRLRGRVSETEFNQMSVRLELQADFYAGVWAHHAQRMKGLLEAGDIEEGLRAASAIGDDKIQKMTQGYVVPDSFTHGSSEQRIRWFRKGLQTGDLSQGDTFNADDL
ncbi:MAG: zinc metallopeptidase [Pirellulales bacterium]|nr:zinc metallopeptidase [Pirellulales bacterium]